MIKKILFIITLLNINTLIAQSNSYNILKKSLLKNYQNEIIDNFENWIKEKEYNIDSLLILYVDDELDTLSMNNWKNIRLENRIKEIFFSKNSEIQSKEFSFKIWTMMGIDQRYRIYSQYTSEKFKEKNKYLDSILKVNVKEFIKLTEKDTENEKLNEDYIYSWIKKNGLPTIEKIGEEAYFSCFLIIQHTGNIKHMKTFLKLIKKEMNKNDTLKNQYNLTYATMYDRYMLLKNKKQCYATQFIKRNTDSEYGYYPIKNIKKLNKRRAKINLPAIEIN